MGVVEKRLGRAPRQADRRSSGHTRQVQGFSLVELLVASMLMLVVVLGIVPLFMRSMMNNAGGNDYTRLSNFSKSQMEELFQLDFNNARLVIPAGQTEVSTDDYWSDTEKKWKPGTAPAGLNPQWTRTTVVRQFNINEVDKTISTFDFEKAGALDGNENAESVHLKEVVVTVRAERGGPMGPERDIVLRTLKAK
ncbi:MAG: prepilin-type N-terminal cleavage/methylation domain-containing protein [Acidobacteriota bacterium]|nr:prepilin-type N-terminal cleavage/methylation domain-containing protein [Acidobacteriota bacterium]